MIDIITYQNTKQSEAKVINVKWIKRLLITLDRDSICTEETSLCTEPLIDFRECNVKEVVQLIKATSKTCALDSLPSSVLSQCAYALAPLIINIINMSITQSDIPELLKEAVVHPLLKKPSLDVDVLSNYRPVSNLPQFSNVLEKVIAKRIQKYTFAMSELYHSAYKSCHSTETSLVCVGDDIKLAFW